MMDQHYPFHPWGPILSEQRLVNTTETRETLHGSLLEALESFYNAAAFYPPGHSKCRDALNDLNGPMEQVVPAQKNLILEPWQEGVRAATEALAS